MRKRGKRAGTALAGAILLSVMAAGCGGPIKSEKADGTSEFAGEFIISPSEAGEKIGEADVLFVDARGQELAAKGTIEGAAVTDWPSLSTCEKGQAGDADWGLVPTPQDLSGRLQRLGISPEKEIIVLGQPEDGWGEDGRIVWELRQAGCENVKIVDGGITAMKDSGVPTDGSPGKPEESVIDIQSLDKSHDITTEELQAGYQGYTIVDVRTVKEYEGARLYDEAQGGHLPGAVNIPYTDLFQADGTLKDNETITKMFEDKGIKKSDKVVVYCTGGIRSAYVQLVLEMCGYENTYNYCQSFWRWAVVGEVE